ncbi:MAG: DNA polymerase III subunit gamma/tau [Desulfotignum sp.]|nr:DNA polymerase III subunit gamma/tau [Desulfotignum sp.]MCF8126264.1 DNA polymerase III subunit gamma/tau [Desulfotignum sp.]
MSYQVLALKYRPLTFDDVVGQSHVTTTLVNAIEQGRVAHAILFTGPRGTGKTTIARILAKAMNCKTGPTPSPCNQCKPCLEIIAGHCADVFEIDGASNNSVDQIRDLRENVTYMPAAAPFKIYIIDEVHMLSTAAFNALLKTLEEPPDHVLFIFATTEVHKIPGTILSRCQRHDLGRIPLDVISGLLKKVCGKEGFVVQNQGLDLIALEADGSVRDALSLLDRILSSTRDKEITYAMVVDKLGALDRRLMQDISNALFEKNIPALISLIEAINDTGLDLKKFYGDIILHFRNLNIIKRCGPDHPAVNMTADEKQKVHTQVAPLPEQYLGVLLQVLLHDESMVKLSAHTRIAIETVMFKLVQIRSGAAVDQIIQKLDALAQQINQSGYPPVSDSDTAKSLPAYTTGDSPTPPAVREPSAGLKSRVPDPDTTGPAPRSPHIAKTWEGFLQQIEQTQPFIFALLSKGTIRETSPDTLELHLYNCSAFDKKRLKHRQDQLKKQCRSFLGKTLEIHVASEISPGSRAAPKQQEIKARHAAYNHPLVKDALHIFNGEIIN